MANVTLYSNFICVLVFGMIIIQVTSHSLSSNTATSNNNDFSHVTPQMPKHSVTEKLSLASNTPDILDDEDESTVPPGITTTVEVDTSTLPLEINTSIPKGANCPFLGVDHPSGTLVKCRCKGDEVLVDGQCQQYPKGTFILAQEGFIHTVEVPVTNYKVIIRDVKCDPVKSRLLQFTKEQFQVRFRGDLVLLESAGDLHGQRINNYCVSHHLEDHVNLILTMKACVPVPAVPRCCPRGQAMKDGSCQPANTPDILTPPIGAKPFYHSVEWPNITNYLSPLTCTNDPVKTIPLLYKKSNLVSLADGLKLGWIPEVVQSRRIYYSCPNYCVDGIENRDGSVSYFTSFCYSNSKERHEKVCDGRPCLRKCCKLGQVMDVNRYGCVPASNATFNIPSVDLSSYNIPIGWPLCTGVSKTDGTIKITESGLLMYKGKIIPSTDYCVDTFVNNDVGEVGALACLSDTTLWQEVRPILFRVCNVISLFFLGITITCHLVVPKLLKNGGVHQLCHAIALTIAYLSSITINMTFKDLSRMTCFPIAIMMQFGFLTTFFWLNVMCFEIWREIRKFKKFQPCKSYPTLYYMMYAWGIPSMICIITVLMQLLAPENIPGLIKPYIGYSRCWFKEDMALLIYFYGPTAVLAVSNTIFLGLTYYTYKHMLTNYKETTKCPREVGAGVKAATASSPPNSISRQFTDHVQDFKQKLLLFVLMSTCWMTEILSWRIPPPELWALTDTLNSLQGLFIFILLLSNRNKRKQIKERFPRPFKFAQQCMKNPSKIKSSDDVFISPVNSTTSKMDKEFSNSSVVSNLNSSLKSSSNSPFSVGAPSLKAQRSMPLNN